MSEWIRTITHWIPLPQSQIDAAGLTIITIIFLFGMLFQEGRYIVKIMLILFFVASSSLGLVLAIYKMWLYLINF